MPRRPLRASRSARSSRCRAIPGRGCASPTVRRPSSGTLIRNANRQPIVSTSVPPTIGPRMTRADVDAAQIPNARARASPSKAWVIRASDPGMSSAPAAPWARRKTHEPLERRGETAQGGRRGEPDEPERVDPPPAVVVGQRPGQDEQRGEDREVAADDVGLALEDADERAGQLLADVLERGVDDRPVEEDRAGPDDRADERPALAGRHAGLRRGDGGCREVSATQCRSGAATRARCVDSRPCPDPWRSSAPASSSPRWPSSMPACSRRPAAPRPRVAILPTASFPDGEEVFTRWATMGVSHFGELGAEVEPVLVRDRAGADDPAAAQAIGEADLVYLSGGKPAYLMGVLDGSAVGSGPERCARARRRPRRLLGGAMVLAGHVFDFRVRLAPWPLRWRHGLGFVEERLGHPPLRRVAGAASRRSSRCRPRAGRSCSGSTRRPRSSGATAAWQVHGRSRVTVWRGRQRDRYRAGETFRI